MNALHLPLLIATLLLLAPLARAAAEEPERKTMEERFSAMLENAALNGTWAPIDKRLLGDDHDDKYRIVRARRKDGDRWVILSRMKVQGQEVDFPIPVTMKFAGDTSVMILEDVPLGQGKTWSARILFHEDVYAGSWWDGGGTKRGIVSGTITRDGGE